jgi:hypothetical protein
MSGQLKAFQAAVEADAGLQEKVKAASDAATAGLEAKDLEAISGGYINGYLVSSGYSGYTIVTGYSGYTVSTG